MSDANILYINFNGESGYKTINNSRISNLCNKEKIKKILIVNLVYGLKKNLIVQGGGREEIFDLQKKYICSAIFLDEYGMESFHPTVKVLADILSFEDLYDSVVELRIKDNNSVGEINEIAKFLKKNNNPETLILCVDKTDNSVNPAVGWGFGDNDSYLRSVMNIWADEVKWDNAFSDFIIEDNKINNSNLYDLKNDYLILRIAFQLGGEVPPKRIFGFSGRDKNSFIHGYCWC